MRATKQDHIVIRDVLVPNELASAQGGDTAVRQRVQPQPLEEARVRPDTDVRQVKLAHGDAQHHVEQPVSVRHRAVIFEVVGDLLHHHVASHTAKLRVPILLHLAALRCLPLLDEAREGDGLAQLDPDSLDFALLDDCIDGVDNLLASPGHGHLEFLEYPAVRGFVADSFDLRHLGSLQTAR
jgi:hypothetical protein